MTDRTVANHHPLLHAFEAVQRARGLSDTQINERAGFSSNALRTWRQGRNPTVANLDAALNVLGFRLVLAPLDDDPSAAVIARAVRRA